MRKTIIFSIVILGISSIIAQLLLIRELTISFYGNEFFIGWIFFGWLFWVGMGSVFLNKIIKKEENLSKILIFCHILIAALLPLEIILSRISRTLISGPTGQIPNLMPSLLYSFFALAPFCLVLGLQFTIFARFWKFSEGKSNLEQILGKSYVFEALGFILGGLFFSYILIFINEFLSASILGWLNLITAFLILFLIKKSNIILKSLTIILIIIFIGISIFSKNINSQINQLRFPHQELIESKNSLYGNIAITKTREQYNFYESGLFLGTNKEEIFNEYVHIPLLYNPNPQNILLVGGGFNGIIKEILKHQPEKVYYLELDPTLIEITKKYLLNDLLADLDDKRVKIINTDARYFLKNTSENFDVIIINLPNPSTALINRFYTEEFIKEAKNHLSENGILSTYFRLPANYFGPEVENLDSSLYKAIKNNFDSVLILPEDQHLFISSQNQVDYNPEVLIQRFKERNIKTNFVNEEYIKYRLTNDRIGLLNDLLNKNKTAKINQDQLPISYYYNFTYWISSFYPKLAKFFQWFGGIKFIWIVISLIVLWFLVLFLNGFRGRSGHGVPTSVGTSEAETLSSARWDERGERRDNTKNLFPLIMTVAGFSLIAIEVIIIFGFQVFYGYLYYKIALIITILMTGMAIGSWLANKKLAQKTIKSIIKIHALIVLFSLILLSSFYFLFKASPRPSIFIEIIFLIAGAIIGVIVGFEFPVINKLYLQNKNDTSKKVGIIYGADLIGSCLGASLISIFILPIFGVFQSLILLGILNFLIVIYFTLHLAKSSSL